MTALSHSPFGHSLRSCPRTLVGIWSSCYAAACNTPYSARFSPRCIAHWARSARIPFQGRLVVTPTKSYPHEMGKVSRRSRDERGITRSGRVPRGVPPQSVSLSLTDSSPASGGAFWCSANSYVKPALKGEVDASNASRRRGCIGAALIYGNPSVSPLS